MKQFKSLFPWLLVFLLAVPQSNAQGLLDMLGVKNNQAVDGQGGESKPAAEEGESSGGIGNWLNSTISSVQNFTADLKPNENEKIALEYILWMLQPCKLGGADSTFNQNDTDMIIEALLQDPSVQAEIRQGIRCEGQRVANSVGGPLLIGRIRRGIRRNVANNRTTPGSRHYPQYWSQGLAQARAQIRAEIETGLAADNIKPIAGQGPSTVRRNVTRKQMEDFKRSVKWLKSYSDRVSKKVGFVYDLPHGLSVEDVKAIIAGTPPPNGKMRKVK